MEPTRDNLADRLKILIDTCADKRGKFAQLENLTDISAEHWKSFYYGRQRPNFDMIEASARLWPAYAFWLATGITDSSHGHIGPASAYECWLNTQWAEQPMAAAYFEKKIKAQEKFLKEGRDQPNDMELDAVMHALIIRDSVHDQNKRHASEVELKMLQDVGEEFLPNDESLNSISRLMSSKTKKI